MLLVDLNHIIILLQLFGIMIHPQMLHQCTDVPANRVGLPEPFTEHTSEAAIFTMVLYNVSTFDQERTPFVLSRISIIVQVDLPDLARFYVNERVAKGTHVVATSFVVVDERESDVVLKIF